MNKQPLPTSILAPVNVLPTSRPVHQESSLNRTSARASGFLHGISVAPSTPSPTHRP